MKHKILVLFGWVAAVFIFSALCLLFESMDCALATVIVGGIIALCLEKAAHAAVDLSDTTDWKASQTKLKRGGFIKDNTIIRISFGYLYRIKVGSKYLLVRNARNTGKFQPVGGVYKYSDNERVVLKNNFNVMDDDKIPIDDSSRDDYRLRMENRFLRRFVRRFESNKAERERVDNVGREFREELVDSGILNWSHIKYRYCGRDVTTLDFNDHFQTYELLLSDVVELIPTTAQENDLKELMKSQSDKYRFATAEKITCLGMDVGAGQLHEWIGDHSRKILQENEGSLMRPYGYGAEFEVDI